MKIWVEKTSASFQGEVREYKSLEEAVEKLLKDKCFKDFRPEVIVSKPDKESKHYEIKMSCDYCIELYDTWRE